MALTPISFTVLARSEGCTVHGLRLCHTHAYTHLWGAYTLLLPWALLKEALLHILRDLWWCSTFHILRSVVGRGYSKVKSRDCLPTGDSDTWKATVTTARAASEGGKGMGQK